MELRHAAHHPDHHVGARALQRPELAELREHLVLGLLADRAGVEEDEVGVVLAVGQLVVVRLEQTRDTLGVVLVHLTAVRDQVELCHEYQGSMLLRP